VFNTYIKYTMMCQSNTTNLYYVFTVLGQHVLILIESSSGPSKKIEPCLEMFKMRCGIPNAYTLDKTMYKMHVSFFFRNVQSGYLFLKL